MDFTEISHTAFSRRDVLTLATGAMTLATAPAMTSAQAQAAAGSLEAAASAVAAAKPAIDRISREVWQLAELSLLEDKSAAVHIRELEAAGFAITSKRTSGYPAAFIAEWSQGAGGPKIGFLPEYDALPGLGNAPEPRQTPAANGISGGHGCGHNMLGSSCTGAAIALKAMMQADGTPGTLRVYGCSAEETEGVKVYMARDGYFDDLDVALAWHPAPFAAAANVRTAALNKIDVEFFGATAHAGVSPWDGRSAADAIELFAHGVNLMREHVLPTARIHYVIREAGMAPNVVPDYARLSLTVRDAERKDVESMTQWMNQLAEGAALGTQTRAKFTTFFGAHDLMPNDPLSRRAYDHMKALGVTRWTDDEQAFACACQAAVGLPEAGLATGIMPFIEMVKVGGSTDVADVSWKVPTCVFAWPTLPLGVSLHTWPVTACAGMSIGERAAVDVAVILAALGHDALTDPELLAAAKADHAARLGGRAYHSPLPEDRKVPLGLENQVTKTGSDEIFSDADTP